MTTAKEDAQTIEHEATIFEAIKELFTEENKKIPLCTSTLFGKEKSVLLSSSTVQAHAHREEITAFDYSLVPLMLEGEKKVFIQDEKRMIVLKKYGKSYRLTLKDIADKDEIFVVSLVDLGRNLEKEIEKLKKKYKEL